LSIDNDKKVRDDFLVLCYFFVIIKGVALIKEYIMNKLPNIKKTKPVLNQYIINGFVMLLFCLVFVIGLVSYFISREVIIENEKEQLVHNVNMAMSLIQEEYTKGAASSVDKETLMEEVKTFLKNANRKNLEMKSDGSIQSATSEYFVILDTKGNEILHPFTELFSSEEIKNVHKKYQHIIDELIFTGLNGGGFNSYDYIYPNTLKEGTKLSYAEYYKPWDWVIVSTSYTAGFYKQLNILLLVMVVVLATTIVMGFLVSKSYTRQFMMPLNTVIQAMGQPKDKWEKLPDSSGSNTEIGQLIEGYNNIVGRLQRDKAELKRKNNHIHHLTYNDELTGLLNRRGFKALVDERIGVKCKRGTFIQFDLLDFKIINSAIGFDKGNVILKTIGEFLQEKTSDTFYAGKTSVNEFSMWIENDLRKILYEFTLEQQIFLEKYLTERGIQQTIKSHVAVSLYPEHGNDFETLYLKANIAMKEAKLKRDLKIYIYDESMENQVVNELNMRKHLKKAIKNQEIKMYYQEKYDFEENKVVGVEALSRWFSDELGVVSPNIFIPAIHQLNYDIEFGDYSIEHVFRDFKRLESIYGSDIKVSVNVSPSYLLNYQFMNNLEEKILEYRIEPSRLIIEVTEDVLIVDFDSVKKTIKKLKNIGVKISIDDFGTGYSSLNYLWRISFDEIKIDKSFIDQIEDNNELYQLFYTICNIAEIFGCELVAEGVETVEQLEMMKNSGLHVIQGYLYSKPESLDEIRERYLYGSSI